MNNIQKETCISKACAKSCSCLCVRSDFCTTTLPAVVLIKSERVCLYIDGVYVWEGGGDLSGNHSFTELSTRETMERSVDVLWPLPSCMSPVSMCFSGTQRGALSDNAR